jgi:hypothetical protein
MDYSDGQPLCTQCVHAGLVRQHSMYVSSQYDFMSDS